ncbi:hypothetical protein KIPB_011840, partial [Kipferlia bialata]|eukprot:g11840.t1
MSLFCAVIVKSPPRMISRHTLLAVACVCVHLLCVSCAPACPDRVLKMDRPEAYSDYSDGNSAFVSNEVWAFVSERSADLKTFDLLVYK